MLYTDADFAGDKVTSKSTSGCYVAISGPNTFAPITAMCKKQGCVSHSSTESGIVAAEYAIRTEGLQILTFWEHVTQLMSSKSSNGYTTTTTTTTKTINAEPVGGSLIRELKPTGKQTTRNKDQLQQSTTPGVPILNNDGFDIDFNPHSSRLPEIGSLEL